MSQYIIANSKAHIENLIDEDVRKKLGIVDRELDAQVLRLCGGFNDLRDQLADLQALAPSEEEGE